MKIVLIIIPTLILAAIVVFFVLGQISQSGEAPGLVDGKLAQCLDKPNCVCTEFEVDVSHYIEPLALARKTTSEVLSRLKNIVEEMDGSIRAENDDYLAATFSSSIFRFVDDLEVRIDIDEKKIHLRSASRVGYSDRGINRNRIESLKNLYLVKTE